MDADRIPQHPDVRTITLQRVLDALVDPVRRSIVTQLRDSPTDIKCGGFDLPVSKSTATHHFRILREAGLVRQYYVGTSRMNALRREEIDETFPGLLDAVVNADRASARSDPSPAPAGGPRGRTAARAARTATRAKALE